MKCDVVGLSPAAIPCEGKKKRRERETVKLFGELIESNLIQ